jgi:hypothetical protein
MPFCEYLFIDLRRTSASNVFGLVRLGLVDILLDTSSPQDVIAYTRPAEPRGLGDTWLAGYFLRAEK